MNGTTNEYQDIGHAFFIDKVITKLKAQPSLALALL